MATVKILSPDAVEGTGAVPSDPSTVQTPTAPAAPPAAAPPPAAHAVVNGRTEREIELETALENERGRADEQESQRLDREKRIMELEDELHRTRAAQRAEAKAKKTGPTFFH